MSGVFPGRAPRVALVLIGIPLLGVGVAAVFLSTNGPGTAVLLGLGGVLTVLALLGDRVDALEVGSTKLRMRAAAAEKYAQADESEERGDFAEAARLRTVGRALLEAGSIARQYSLVRQGMESGPARVRAMEELVARARLVATEGTVDPEEVRQWLRSDDESRRITALAMMQARTDLRDFEAALQAVTDSKSAFEQYHAMLLTKLMATDLDQAQQQRLVQVIHSVKGHRFGDGSMRGILASEILIDLGHSPDAAR